MKQIRDKNIGQVEIKIIHKQYDYVLGKPQENKQTSEEFLREFTYLQRQLSCVSTTIQVRRCNDKDFT